MRGCSRRAHASAQRGCLNALLPPARLEECCALDHGRAAAGRPTRWTAAGFSPAPCTAPCAWRAPSRTSRRGARQRARAGRGAAVSGVRGEEVRGEVRFSRQPAGRLSLLSDHHHLQGGAHASRIKPVEVDSWLPLIRPDKHVVMTGLMQLVIEESRDLATLQVIDRKRHGRCSRQNKADDFVRTGRVRHALPQSEGGRQRDRLARKRNSSQTLDRKSSHAPEYPARIERAPAHRIPLRHGGSRFMAPQLSASAASSDFCGGLAPGSFLSRSNRALAARMSAHQREPHPDRTG